MKFNIREVHSKPRLHVSVKLLFELIMAAILRDSVAVVVPTRLRAIPLATITMRKSIDGFPFLSHMSIGLRLAVLRAAVAPPQCIRLSEKSLVLFIQYPPTNFVARSAASRPNIFYPEIHEVGLWQV